MSRIPTYSLLEKHEDVVSYRIPDPGGETPAWIRLGLYAWELEGVPIGEALGPNPTEEEIDAAIERSEGIGLRVKFHGPTPAHPRPEGFEDVVSDTMDVFSKGFDKHGRTFRIQNAGPAELRQLGRWIALYGFAFWWWVEEHTTYPLNKHGTREEMQVPVPAEVLEDGTVLDSDGESYSSPYTLADMELLSPDEWETPYERAVRNIEDVVGDLDGDVPTLTVRKALRDVANDIELPTQDKTAAKKERERLEDALRDADGIGFQLRNAICREFETVSGLCDDIRAGGERVRSISGIGESKEEAVIDALVESGAWEKQADPAEETNE